MFITGRLSGLFLSAPIFTNRQIPVRVKIFIILTLAAILSYIIPLETSIVDSPARFIAALIAEIFVGYTFGLVIYVVFAAIQLAGQVMDMQMGFGIVNVVDPVSGTQIPLIGNLIQLIALLIYLSINGHHYLLQALAQSYQVIPVLGLNMQGGIVDYIVALTVQMFVIAVKIAIPVVVAILTTDVAMGFIARTVPQMNVFIVGLPLKILMGLIMLTLMVPIYIWLFQVLFENFFGYLDQAIILMGK